MAVQKRIDPEALLQGGRPPQWPQLPQSPQSQGVSGFHPSAIEASKHLIDEPRIRGPRGQQIRGESGG